MSSTPSPVVSSTAPVSVIHKISTYVQTHHPLIRLVIIALLIWVVWGKAVDLWANHEQKVFDAKSQSLQAQVDANAKQAVANADLAKQAQTLAANYQTLAASTLVENTKLQQINSQLVASTRKQQQADTVLPPAGLAARWQDISGLPVNSVTPNTDGSFGITGPAALVTVQQLENIAPLQAQLANVQTEKDNADKQLAAQGGVVTGLNNQVVGLQAQVTGLRAQNVKQVEVCTAQVNLVKAQARKSKRRYFVAGYVAGFGTAVALKIYHLL